MYPSRTKAEIARDTIEILAAGRYTNSRSEKVTIRISVVWVTRTQYR
jgi:hypothetical protein